MNILLIGYGQMGKLLHRIALERGHEVKTVDPSADGADLQQLTPEVLHWAGCSIDFSHPDAVLGNIETVCAAGGNLVMGSTGWYDHRDDVRSMVERAGVGFLYASNFSLGVNLYMKMVREAARIMNRFEEYDVSGVETHHVKKVDSPSGTAQTLTEILLETIERKDVAQFDAFHQKPAANELHFASIRSGANPGTHEVIFDSEADTISLKHTARNRDGFARGAVYAAEWLQQKKGFYTIDDFVRALIDKQ